MALETRERGQTYYYRKVRRGGKVISEYMGCGEAARLMHQIDSLEHEQRDLECSEQRVACAALVERLQPPEAMQDFCTQLRTLVEVAYRTNGYYQHKGQWRRQRMTTELATDDQAWERLVKLYHLAKPSRAELDEYSDLLEAHPKWLGAFGDLAQSAQSALLGRFDKVPQTRAAVRAQCREIRKGLCFGGAPMLEQLLIDQIVLCWLDLHYLQMAYGQDKEAVMARVEGYERLVASKQSRYTRAIEALARVRKLNIQINVSIGGQQLNVQ